MSVLIQTSNRMSLMITSGPMTTALRGAAAQASAADPSANVTGKFTIYYNKSELNFNTYTRAAQEYCASPKKSLPIKHWL